MQGRIGKTTNVDLKGDIERLLNSIVGKLQQQKVFQQRQEQEQLERLQKEEDGDNDKNQRQKPLPQKKQQQSGDIPSASNSTLNSSKQYTAAAISEAMGLMLGFGDDADAYWHSTVLPQLVQVRRMHFTMTTLPLLPASD